MRRADGILGLCGFRQVFYRNLKIRTYKRKAIGAFHLQ